MNDDVIRMSIHMSIFRVGLDFNKQVINELWSDVLKNKDGTVDLWELIRQFGAPHSK